MRGRRSKIPLTMATTCAVLALAAPTGAAAEPADPTFARARSYEVGIDPSYVTAADLDSDSKADLVVSNQESDDVSVLRKEGNGTFARPVNYEVGISPASVAAADLSGDGKADLAVTNQGSPDGFTFTISVLMNEGDGTFQEAVDYEVGRFPQGIVAKDLDGDGRLDLAVTNSDPQEGSPIVSVLKNRGDGTFRAPVNFGVEGDPGSITAKDFNGDGKADLATANYFDNTVSVLANTGDGTFKRAVYYDVGRHPLSVTAADLNGDGKADLATANGQRSGSVSVLKNRGSGTFKRAVDYGVGRYPGSVFAADLNGDHKADLVAANFSDATISVLTNRGSGTFGKPTTHRVGRYPTSVTAADLGGSKKPDLAISNLGPGTVSVLINTTKNRSPTPQCTSEGTTGNDVYCTERRGATGPVASLATTPCVGSEVTTRLLEELAETCSSVPWTKTGSTLATA